MNDRQRNDAPATEVSPERRRELLDQGKAQPQTPEPARRDQVDVANDVQEGLADANERAAPTSTEDENRATRPNGGTGSTDARTDTFKPADDTPSVLPSKRGPRE